VICIIFKEFIQFCNIGKNLGLKKKEIQKILIFDNSKHRMLNLFILIVGIVILGGLIILLGIEIARNIYPSGTLYSTVKTKDFGPRNFRKSTSKK
jgi:hypothetical protein